MAVVNRQEIQTVINAVAQEYGIRKAFLFGSYARNEQTAQSDIDILFELDKPLGFKRGRVCLELESKLGAPVDVVFGKELLYLPIRSEFEREAVLVYER